MPLYSPDLLTFLTHLSIFASLPWTNCNCFFTTQNVKRLEETSGDFFQITPSKFIVLFLHPYRRCSIFLIIFSLKFSFLYFFGTCAFCMWEFIYEIDIIWSLFCIILTIFNISGVSSHFTKKKLGSIVQNDHFWKNVGKYHFGLHFRWAGCMGWKGDDNLKIWVLK